MPIPHSPKPIRARMALLFAAVICTGLAGCHTFHGGMYSGPRLGPIVAPSRSHVSPFGQFPGPTNQCCQNTDLYEVQGKRQPLVRFRPGMGGTWPAASNYHSHHDPGVIRGLKSHCQCENCRSKRRQKTVRYRQNAGSGFNQCCNPCQSCFDTHKPGCQTCSTCNGNASNCANCHGDSVSPPHVPPMNETYDSDPGERTFEHEDAPGPPTEEEQDLKPAARVFPPPAPGVTQTGYFDPVTGTLQPSAGSHPLHTVPGELVIQRRIQ